MASSGAKKMSLQDIFDRLKTDEQSIKALYAKGIKEFCNSRGVYAAYTPSLEIEGGYRITFYDEDGLRGHVETSRKRGFRVLSAEGYTIPAEGSMDQLLG
jgi:hypothetical protein